MDDQQEWPPERLRALDRAVAEARGDVVAFDMPDGEQGPRFPWIYAGGDKERLPEYSLGCAETFELMEEAGINVTALVGSRWLAIGEPYEGDGEEAPTPAIAICLAYLASKGRSFNE